MTRRISILAFVALFGLTVSSAFPTAQFGTAAAAPAVTEDADYAAFVKKATTNPEFLSPLVDHLAGLDARNSCIKAAFLSFDFHQMSTSGPMTGMAPSSTSTSTFDSIFETRLGGGPY